MSLFDRFRQPKWKHADPAIRLEAVNELGDEAQDVLRSVAREDADPAVRRRAVARVEDVATLASVARSDMDEGVRAEARKLLMDVATDGSHEEEAMEALAGLDDERDLAGIARTTDSESVGLAALRRVSAPRVVGSIAGRASHGGIRLAALALIEDPTERGLVALNSEHKDVALSALESIDDPRLLEQAAARAKNKLVARRARALLRERHPVRPTGPAAPVGELSRDRLCDMLEGLARETRPEAIQPSLDAATEAWQQISVADDQQSLLQARFEAAAAAARARLEQLRAEAAATQADAEARLAQDTRRAEVCQQLEDYAGDDIEDAVTEAQAGWGALDAEGEPGSEAVHQRMAAAIARQRARLAARLADAERHTQLAALADEAEALTRLDDLADAHKRWAALLPRWTALAQDGAAVDPVLVTRVKAAEAAIAARTAAGREQESALRADNLRRARESCDRLEAIARREGLTLKEADQAVRDARATAESLGALPSRDDQAAIVDRLKKVQTALLDVVRDLRSSDDWKRWANATVQQELCEKAEALAGVEALPDVARQLKELRLLWKQASAGPRGAEGDALWQRFKAAADAAQARVDVHFTQRSVEDAAALQEKVQLVEQAEMLAQSTDWLTTADALKALQQRWNALGHGPRDQAKALNSRFRAACDTFFTRRKEDLQQRKDTWSANQAVKEGLIAQAEALAESTEWAHGVERIKQLQAEWKASGPVKRQKSEQLWQRFRAACDRFFERYKNRHSLEFDSRRLTREQALTEFEALADTTDEHADPAAILAQAQQAWQAWRSGPPLPRDVVRAMQERFGAAAQRLVERYPDVVRGSPLDPAATRARMVELVDQVEQVAAQAPQAAPVPVQATPAAALATMLREALASNTIGGRVDDQARRRAAQDTVRAARAAWSRLGPLAGEEAAELERRFASAARRFDEPAGEGRGPRSEARPPRGPRADAGRTPHRSEARPHKG